MDKENYSRPVVQKEVTSYSETAHQVVELFRQVDRSLFRAYKKAYLNGNIPNLEEIIDNLYKTMEDDLRQGITELDARCAEARVRSGSYDKSFHNTVRHTHPSSFRFLRLFQDIDILMCLAEKLFSSNIVNETDHLQFVKIWRCKFIGLTRKLERLATWQKISSVSGSPEAAIGEHCQDAGY